MRLLEKDSLTKKILNHLAESSKEFLKLSAKIMFDPHGLIRESGFGTGYTKSHVSREIYHLKRSRYFNFKNNKYCLTPRGRIEIIKIILKKKIKKSKWDGKWRGIIFDIPEINRRDRRFLRNELKLIGFVEAQKSIWVFPYDIEKELKALLKLWKMDFKKGDIRFILIEKMNDEDLRNVFGL